MICPNCKKEINNEALFCPYCGFNFTSPGTKSEISSNTKNIDKKYIIIFVAIIVVAGIVFGINCFKNKQSNNTDVPPTNQVDNKSNDVSSSEENDSDNEGKEIFLLEIEDVFSITGRGTVVTGKVLSGSIKVSDEIDIIGLDHDKISTKVTGIQRLREDLEQANAGDNISLFLDNVSRNAIERGQVVVTSNSLSDIKEFEADVSFTSEDGEEQTALFEKSKPQIAFNAYFIPSKFTLPEKTQKLYPGDNVHLYITLDKSRVVQVGDKFTVKDGQKYIGTGTVTKVYDN